jgi:hypothetical protein
MKAVVWPGVGDIRLDDVADPRIEQPTDAIAVCPWSGRVAKAVGVSPSRLVCGLSVL